MPPRVQVLQSHRTPLPAAWYETCTASVRKWAEGRGYDYRWMGDELFDPLSAELKQKTLGQRAIAADLGRLHALRQSLAAGFDTAVWIDADVFVLAPERLELLDAGHAFGREVWVQSQGADWRVYSKVHNAFMQFAAGDPLLGAYLYLAERILYRHQGALVPQLIGPKLLATLHNLLDFPVIESAGVLSPPVVRDLLTGSGPALDLFRARSTCIPAAVNLCGSLVAAGELVDAEIDEIIERLRSAPELLAQLRD
ncbi:MAG: hypothetical protein R3E82_00705 [Pseudomonadales bacterium]